MSSSVVIPAHRAAATIARAVRSALADPAVLEVVVVDDGSPDDTAAQARAIADDRVRVVQQACAGPCGARNRGANEARGDLLVFLDADDELAPGAMATFRRAPADALLVRTGAIVVHDDGSRVQMLAVDDDRPNPRGAPYAGSFAIDRDLFLRIGGYDERFAYGENSELLLRARLELDRLGARAAFVDAATVVYEQRPGRSDAYAARKLASVELMLDEHRAAFARDAEYLAHHLAIAAHLQRSEGRRRAAVRSSIRLVGVRPTSARAWGSLALSVAAPRPGGAVDRLARRLPRSGGQDVVTPLPALPADGTREG